MSISSISSNGIVYSRPVKRRADIERPQEENFQQNKTNDRKKQTNDFELQLRNNEAQRFNTSKSRERNETSNIIDFISHLDRLPPSSDRATNAYNQIGSFEKQQELRQMFGVDVFV